MGASVVAASGTEALMYGKSTNVPVLRKASMSTALTEALGKTLEGLEYQEVSNKDASFTNSK